MGSHGLNLTEGRISTLLLRFAAPFLATSVMQALHGAADLFVVGRYATSTSISAVAISTQIMQIIIAMTIGLSMGNTVLIGRSIGEKNEEASTKGVGTVFSLALIVMAVLTPVVFFLADSAVSWMQTPAEAVETAVQYVRICAVYIPFMVGFNFISSIQRGMGDSKTPSLVAAAAAAVNIGLDFLLVGGFDMGAGGAAIATVIAHVLSFCVLAAITYRRKFPFPFQRKDFRIFRAPLRYIAKVGTPIALQETLVNLSFLIILALINTLGVAASASVGVVQRILGITFMLPMAFGSAVAAITAQNLGAGKRSRAIQSLRWGIGYALVFGIFVFAYSQFWGSTLTSVFTSDTTVIALGAQYLKSYAIDCMMIAFIFCMNAYFSGCGKSIIAMIHSLLATFLIRIPFSFFMIHTEGVTMYQLGFAAPLASSFSLIVLFGYFFWQKRSEKKILAGTPVSV